MTIPMPTILRVLPLAVALLGALALMPEGAQAAVCPASIAPVKGGLGDATSLGLDDGVRREDGAYEPGQLVVILRPGRTAKELQCVADELRAVVIDGGAGRRGLGGIPNAVILQLQPGVSVQQTARHLQAERYSALILSAQPNAIAELARADNQRDPTVNDPLFPVQWGVSNGGQVPDRKKPFPEAFAPGDLLANPFTSTRPGLRYSMRTRQAWALLARRTVPGGPRVRVAIVDNSLWQHQDLEANVADDGNARYRGESGSIRIELLKRVGKADLSIYDEWGERRTLCPLSWDADAAGKGPDPTWIAAMVASQTNARCGTAQPPKTWRLTIDNAHRGSVVFSYDGRPSRAVDLSALWDESGDRAVTLRAIEIAIAEVLTPPPARPDVTRVAAALRSEANWGDSTSLGRELRIVIYGGPAALTVDAAGLSGAARSTSGIASTSTASSVGQVGVGYATSGSFRIRYAVSVLDPLPNGQFSNGASVEIETAPIFIGGERYNSAEVKSLLETALRSFVAGLPANDPAAALIEGFEVQRSSGYPRVYVITTKRPVGDASWIISESYTLTDVQNIQSPVVDARLGALAPIGTLGVAAGGELVIDLARVPALKGISATGGLATAGIRAAADAVEVIDPQRKWPGGLDATSSHGQFIAGVIGAQAGNGIGMAGVIGDSAVTGANIKLNGVVTSLDSGGTLSMLEYADEKLKAPVINYSIGGDSVANKDVNLLDETLPLARRDEVLRGEDPMEIEPTNYLFGNVTDDSRSLFVVASANYGSDLRRPLASRLAQIERYLDAWAKDQENATKVPPTAAERKAEKARVLGEMKKGKIPKPKIGLNPCRPKGMGITQRPLGVNAHKSAKGGALSMLRMPDGTFDRGNLLCVASATWNGELSEFSNWGPGIVDVAAPGSNIIGTGLSNGYSSSDGTSYAAPMVAGVAAMVYSVLPNAQPWLVKCAILSSATSKPLRPADPTKEPFTHLTETVNGRERIPYPDGSPLTVNGMVQASEAISAALHLDARVRQVQRGSSTRWPSCVQKRGLFGGWKSATPG